MSPVVFATVCGGGGGGSYLCGSPQSVQCFVWLGRVRVHMFTIIDNIPGTPSTVISSHDLISTIILYSPQPHGNIFLHVSP